jgi:GMP synthase (glutamine-hydrolysing)
MSLNAIWLLIILVCSLISVPFSAAAPTQERNDKKSVGPSSTWIVVNMFTGKSSKQAVKVREILSSLGAEGHGIVLPYNEITVENIKRINPVFLALSPNGIPWCRYKGKNGTDLDNFFKDLKTIIEELDVPVIGICGGHQALALAFGGKVGPIKGGEDDCFPYGHNPTERGRKDISVVNEDPLFDGMGKTLNLVQNHYDEVKKLPSGFINLAENNLCKYQIIKHPLKPAYGVQAHTEYFLRNKPDGGLLLRNFINIAKSRNGNGQLAPQESQAPEDSGSPAIRTTRNGTGAKKLGFPEPYRLPENR